MTSTPQELANLISAQTLVNLISAQTLANLISAQTLANLISAQTIERLRQDKLDCQHNIDNSICTVKPGKKYIKIDRGTSGAYMIDEAGQIFGIKAYGVIHHGHYYGTLDTINDYNWGDYQARKVV